MKLSISHKLVLSFLSLTLLVLIATLGLARWSFERGFLDYVNAAEQARLERVSVNLGRFYTAGGNGWENLTSEAFESIVRWRTTGSPQPPNHSRPTDQRPSPRGFPPPGVENADRPPPPRISGEEARLPSLRRNISRGLKTALFDLQDNQIAGLALSGKPEEHIRVPVIINNKKVGELRSLPRRQFDTPQETAFSKQQMNTSLLIGGISLALATMASLLLAGALLAPVRRMIKGVARLSDGDYSAQINEGRSDELGELMRDFDRLSNTLAENRASRKRWLADISHELRTPVSVISGEIEAMKDGVRKLDMQQLDSLDDEVARLRYLIDDLYQLSLSDIGGLRYKFATLDLGEYLHLAATKARARASEQGIQINVNAPKRCWIKADVQRLDQLFTNLIENSLAYTDSPGRISITATQFSNQILINIEDTPPGVDAATCEKLFEPLYRQDESRSRRIGGAGLGLAICRNIVNAHKGTISASPAQTGGLCIETSFPAAKEPNP